MVRQRNVVSTTRERELVLELRASGWVAWRMPASLGAADVIALRADWQPLAIQVKTDRDYAFTHFGPKERQALLDLAEKAGALPWLVWWPPDRKGKRWLGPSEWPGGVMADVA